MRKIIDGEEYEIPQHVAIIMDGNGRWAKKRLMPRNFGHKEGAKTLEKIVRYANKIGIKYITVYASSTENWKRTEEEVSTLMNLFQSYLDDYSKRADSENIKVKIIGSKNGLSEKMKNSISPIFTEKLSSNIAKITKGKYTNLYLSDEQGLTVEIENGNYVPAERLSIGTIDQLYLSLRLAMLDEISNEKVPIILDEAFAYYDNDRLKNILIYLTNEFKDRQIIILTCTTREKDILKQLKINYNYVEL